MKRAILVLEDGEVFEGAAFGAQAESFGEVVFNTSMTGYQEVLTDPSYAGQIVCMTYPHIGNYGVNEEDTESSQPRTAGLITRDVPPAWSSWRGIRSIEEYLNEWEVPGITEIDTRRLTRHLRDRGAMRGAFSSSSLDAASLVARVGTVPEMVGLNLVDSVTAGEPYRWPCESPQYRVVAYDYGIKFNIMRLLAGHGVETTVFPANTPASEVLAARPDGVFLSNGPGDPAAARHAIDSVAKLIGRLPIFGICLGHQLIALACGLETYKLPFGHRGINHPVARLEDGAVEITTQNHGFAVGEAEFGYVRPDKPGDPLPPPARARTRFGDAVLTHVNLNDHTIEGFRLASEPVFCVQYHPEAGPGPHDSRYLFEDFVRLMEGGE